MKAGPYPISPVMRKRMTKIISATINGFKIVQFSDLHVGSFKEDYAKVQRGLDMIQGLNPDLIVFTGDMVNNYAYEIDGWETHLSKLHAPFGKFSVLGNHDYGDYVPWKSKEEKQANLNRLKQKTRRNGISFIIK